MSNATHPKPLTPSWNLLPTSIELLRKHFVPLLYVFLIPSLITDLGSTLAPHISPLNARTITGLVLIGIGWLASALSLAAYVTLQLKAVHKQDYTLPELYAKSFRRLPRLIGLMIVVGVVVAVGSILLIVPGLIMFRRYFLAQYYLMDENLSIREAMRRSAAASKPAAGYIWGVFGVIFVFGLISAVVELAAGSIGQIAGTLLGALYIFGPVLRYKELRDNPLPPAAKRKRKSNGWSTIDN